MWLQKQCEQYEIYRQKERARGMQEVYNQEPLKKSEALQFKHAERSGWQETREGLPQPADGFPRRLHQECQEGAEQR